MTALAVTETRIRTARLSLHVLRSVPAAPVGRVLLLGGSNFDLRLKRGFLSSPLARHFEILTFEPRGIGRSDQPAGVWSMEDYARDAASLMNAVGWDQADVVGESFGGMTALHFARLFPSRVARMALASTTAGGEGGGSVDIRALSFLPPAEAAAEAIMLLDRENHRLRDIDPEAFDKRVRARMAFDASFRDPSVLNGGYGKLLAARAAHDAWDDLQVIQHQTIVITGTRDRQAPPPAQSAMAQRLPCAEHRLYDAGHAVAFAREEPMLDVCSAWGATAESGALRRV
jgi:3-oxoadipate enol-lactonase